MKPPQFEEVIEDLYDAVVHPELWAPLCDQLAAAVDAKGTILIPDEPELRRFGLPQSESLLEATDDYIRNEWYLHDERSFRRDLLARTQPICVIFDQDFVTPEEMHNSAYYQEFLRPNDLMWCAGVHFNVNNRRWVASIQRTSEQGAFEESERHWLELLSGHLSRAATTATALSFARAEGAVEAFEQMSLGALAIDEREHVVLANSMAQSLMGDGIQITEGRLRFTNQSVTNQLMSFIKTGMTNIYSARAGRYENGLIVPRPSGKRAYRVEVCPLGPRGIGLFGGARVIVLIIDPERAAQPQTQILRARFGLSQCEAKLAEQLANGRSLAEASDILSITIETARSYLKSIFAKTDTHRQGQLVALLAKLNNSNM